MRRGQRAEREGEPAAGGGHEGQACWERGKLVKILGGGEEGSPSKGPEVRVGKGAGGRPARLSRVGRAAGG